MIKTDNAYEAIEAIVKACVERFRILFLTEGAIHTLHLWIYDPALQFICNDGERLEERLHKEFRKALLTPLLDADIEFHPCRPCKELAANYLVQGQVDYSFDLDVQRESVKPVQEKADQKEPLVLVHLTLTSSHRDVEKVFTLRAAEHRTYRLGRVRYFQEQNRINDLVIDDEHVSRAQADLYFSGDELYLHLCGEPFLCIPAGGGDTTAICSRELAGYRLHDGDRLAFGDSNPVIYEVSFGSTEDSGRQRSDRWSPPSA